MISCNLPILTNEEIDPNDPDFGIDFVEIPYGYAGDMSIIVEKTKSKEKVELIFYIDGGKIIGSNMEYADFYKIALTECS